MALAAVCAAPAATRVWDGGGADAYWSTAANWDGDATAPVDGDTLVFTADTYARLSNTNDLADLTVNGIHATNAFASILVITGNAITNTGGIVVGSTANGRSLTLNTPIAVTSTSQVWTAQSGSSVFLVNGNITGTGGVSFESNDMGASEWLGGAPNIRLAGNNAGWTGAMVIGKSITGQREGVLLMSPSAVPGGQISITQRSALGLNGSGVSTPYVIGIGSGNGNISFAASNNDGVAPVNGNAIWDPAGANNSYTLTATYVGMRQGPYSLSGAQDFSCLFFGTAGKTLVLNVAPTFNVTGYLIARMAFGLDDGGASRNLTKTGMGALSLEGANAVGGLNGGTTISEGAIAVTGMDQIFNGNLNLNGGALLLNNLAWQSFVNDRSGGYGAGASQWQITAGGGGFAARGNPLTIDGNGTTTNTFARSFTLGAEARNPDGTLFADQAVVISQDIGMTANHAISARGGNMESTTRWTVNSPVHEISGLIGDASGSRILNLQGIDRQNTRSGAIRISNTGNSFSGGVRINSTDAGGAGGGGGVIAIFPDDACFGPGSVYVGTGNQGAAGMLCFENQGSGTKDFAKAFTVSEGGDASSGDSGFGSWAGTVRYNGVATITGNRTTLPVHVQAGRLLFGPTAQLVNNSTGGTQTYNKGGAGTLVLSNNAVYAGSAQSLRWALQEGTIETWSPAVVTNGATAFEVKALFVTGAGANIQTAGTYERTWAIRGQDHSYSLSGGHYGVKFWLDVGAGLTLTFEMGSSELANAEVYGSGAGSQSGVANGMIKTGPGAWVYRSDKAAASSSGNRAMAVRVQQGTFDVTGPMARGGLWLDGGVILSGTNSPFTASAAGSRLRVDPTGGKIGISATALGNVTRSANFDGTDNTWNLGGTGVITLASRGDFNLVWSASTFPDIAAGETVLIERDGTGTGVVQIDDAAWTIAGRIGGTGGLKLGSGGGGTLTVSGGLKAVLASNTQSPLTVAGNVVLNGAAVDVSKAPGYSPSVTQWVILEASALSGSVGAVTPGYAVTQTATQLILNKYAGAGTILMVK